MIRKTKTYNTYELDEKEIEQIVAKYFNAEDKDVSLEISEDNETGGYFVWCKVKKEI